jgi:hypothetical protein
MISDPNVTVSFICHPRILRRFIHEVVAQETKNEGRRDAEAGKYECGEMHATSSGFFEYYFQNHFDQRKFNLAGMLF